MSVRILKLEKGSTNPPFASIFFPQNMESKALINAYFIPLMPPLSSFSTEIVKYFHVYKIIHEAIVVDSINQD